MPNYSSSGRELWKNDVQTSGCSPFEQEQPASVHNCKYMEQINRANNQMFFINSFSHMFNGPINSILLGSELLKNYVEDVNDQLDNLTCDPERLTAGKVEAGVLGSMSQVIQGISTSALSLNQFVTLLSGFFGTGTAASCHSVNIKQLITHYSFMIRHQTIKYSNNFNLDIENDLPDLSGNSQKILQATHNLLMNAFLSLPDQSCKVDISASYNRTTGCIQMSIQDEGVGIPPDVFRHIFDPFFSTWSKHGCVGLGLTVAKRIIHDHGGELSIDTEPGKGTIVSVSLPLHGKANDLRPERKHA
jgi:signal transduction histidine kinase